MLKYKNNCRGGQATNKTPQDRKIKLSDIETDQQKLRNLLSATQNRKPKKRRYYDDVYSGEGFEPEKGFSKNDDENAMRKLSKTSKDSSKERSCSKENSDDDGNQACLRKREKTTKMNYRLYKQLIVIK